MLTGDIIARGKKRKLIFRIATVSEPERWPHSIYRGESQRHRVPGTGMGLAIAKAIVEAHGGNIEVVSQAGKGSVFTFSLPMERANERRFRERALR